MKNIICILLSIIALNGCKKNHVAPNEILNGKIQSIAILDNDKLRELYHYYYDSVSGNLKRIVRDSAYQSWTIINKTDSSVLILVNYETSSGYITIKYNNHGYEYSASEEYRLTNNISNQIDSIFEYRNNFLAGSYYYTNYDFVYDGNNYTQSKIHLDQYGPGGIFSYSLNDTINYTYTAFDNPGNLPLQRLYGNYPYWLQIEDDIFEPGYILGLLGYKKANKNLIRNYQIGSQSIEFDYTFNNKNQIIEFTTSKSDYRYLINYY